MEHLILPIPSLSGSSLACLADDCRRVADALHDALDALKYNPPNQRDYQGDTARWNAKLSEHNARIAALVNMRVAILDEALWLMEQDKDREARCSRAK